MRQVRQVFRVACRKIVDANNRVTLAQKAIGKMGA